jgi:transposase
MDLAQYAVTAVLVEGRSVRSVATSTGRSKSWVQRHVALYREGGEDALVPRKRGPAVAINRTASEMEDAIIAMRKSLADQGYDAGARTLRYHLTQAGTTAPALATIHRVLQRRGFVTPNPRSARATPGSAPSPTYPTRPGRVT